MFRYVIIILASLCGLIAALSVALLGFSFTRAQRSKYKILKKLDGKQIHLAVIFVVFSVASYGVTLWKDVLTERHPFDLSQGPRGELSQKATDSEFLTELQEASGEEQHAAKDYFNAAERHFALARYREAATDYQLSVNAVPTQSAYLNLGISQTYLADYGPAEAALNSGLRLSRSKGKKEFEANFLLGLANINFLQKRDASEAIRAYGEAQEIFRAEGNVMGQARALNNIGVVYLFQGKQDEAIKHLQSALDAFKQFHATLGQARVFLNLGSVYHQQGKSQESLNSTQQSLKLYEQLNNAWGQGQAHITISRVYMSEGKLDEALISGKNAVEMHKRSGDQLSLADALNNLNLVYREQKDLENSLASVQAAFEIYKHLDNALGKALALANIGLIYEDQGNLNEALKNYEPALELMGGRFPSGRAGVLICLGSANAKLRRFQIASKYLDEAIKLSTDLGEPTRIGDATHAMGLLYYKKGDYAKALTTLKHARDIYQGANIQGVTVTENREMIEKLEASARKKT